MSQPLDRTCKLPALGKVNTDAGEFWSENPFDMPRNGDNLSAYERNCIFINYRGKSFIDVSYASQADIDSDSRSVVAADFDRDGEPDILVANVGGGPLRMFRNQFPRDMKRVRLELVGTRSNLRGVGARVTAEAGGQKIVRDNFPMNGCMGLGPVEMLIGVGAVTRIDRLTVCWPSGVVQELKGLPVDCQLTITEGRADFKTSELSLRPLVTPSNQ
ncbi:MAG: CRTAC1 family protein [Verrucomicrobiota bacterium]